MLRNLSTRRTPRPPPERGRPKQSCLVGWPAEDLAGYVDGESHPIALSTENEDWELRD